MCSFVVKKELDYKIGLWSTQTDFVAVSEGE
jgi:hypothetical protein